MEQAAAGPCGGCRICPSAGGSTPRAAGGGQAKPGHIFKIECIVKFRCLV